MAKASKAGEPPKADDLPFEEALKKLGAIVEAMESEELPLETLLRVTKKARASRACASPNWPMPN